MENEENRKKEKQEIERLRQKQIEEAKRKLIKANERIDIIRNTEKQNRNTLKQIARNNLEIANDDIFKDMATGITLTSIGVVATTNVAVDNITKIINKPKK